MKKIAQLSKLPWSNLQKIKNKIKHFISLYDPSYMGFIYALKALFASILSALLAMIIFNFNIAIWCGLIPIHLYFLNVILSEQKQMIWYFIFFIFLTAIIVCLFNILIPYPFIFAIALMCIGFIAGIIGSYQLDLQRVINMSLVDGLVAHIYTKSDPSITLKELIYTIFIGGGIGIITHFYLSFKKYGKFTRKYFPDLLLNLELMANSLHKHQDFVKLRHQTSNQIEFIKKILNSKAAKMKDTHTIKNTKRALFYLYRIEEIYQCINAIHNDEMVREKKFSPIRREIVLNLRELRKIFEGHVIHLKEQALNQMQSQDFNYSLINITKIIYNKCHSFRRGGEEEDYFIQVQKEKTLKVIWQSIKKRDHFFYFSIKYAFVLGMAMFIANIFQIHNGTWIAMACVAIMRPNLGGIKYIGKEYLIGISIGLIIGIILISLTQGSIFFYLCFILVIFFFIYFRAFPYGLWACFMMLSFMMIFALVYGMSYGLIFNRLIDIILAFGIVFFAFLLFWPRYSANEILPNVYQSLIYLQDFYEALIHNFDRLMNLQHQIHIKQKDFLTIYSILETNIEEAKKEKKALQEINFGKKSLKYLDYLNQSTLKLYYMFLESPPLQLQKEKELYINDLILIKTRYEMINRALKDHTFYFKELQDDRFLSQDAIFNEVVKRIFEAQNRLFKSIKN